MYLSVLNICNLYLYSCVKNKIIYYDFAGEVKSKKRRRILRSQTVQTGTLIVNLNHVQQSVYTFYFVYMITCTCLVIWSYFSLYVDIACFPPWGWTHGWFRGCLFRLGCCCVVHVVMLLGQWLSFDAQSDQRNLPSGHPAADTVDRGKQGEFPARPLKPEKVDF